MRYVSFMTAALALVWIAGCATREAVYDDVAATRTASYNTWAQADKTKTESLPSLSGDLSLENALEIALVRNRDIQSAVEGKMAAQGRLLQGYSEAMPKIIATGSYRRLDKTPQSTSPPTTITVGTPPNVTTFIIAGRTVVLGDKDNYRADVTIAQPLFHGGAILATINAAQILAFMSDEQLRATVEGVMYGASHAYFDAQLAQKLFEVAGEAVNAADAHLKDVTRKKEAGIATQFDVLRAEVEVANRRADIIRQQSLRDLATVSLLKTIGVSQRSNVTLTTTLEPLPIKPVIEAAVKSAYEKRPDLYLAEMDVRVQREAVQLAKSLYLPMLDAYFTQIWSNPDPHVPTDISWGRQWYAGLSASWAIFDGFRREGLLAEQNALLRQKLIRLADVEQTAQLDLKQAMLRLRDAEQLIETQALNVEHAKEGHRLARIGFPEVTTTVEVTDALSALVIAEGLQAQAFYEHTVARLDLQKAMGLLAPAPGEREPTRSAPTPAVIEEFMAPADQAPATTKEGTDK